METFIEELKDHQDILTNGNPNLSKKPTLLSLEQLEKRLITSTRKSNTYQISICHSRGEQINDYER
jgi:hypothetical protein